MDGKNWFYNTLPFEPRAFKDVNDLFADIIFYN